MASKLQEGKKAPDFKLPSSEGDMMKLSDFQGKKNVVLYFYPKDNTPGCTQESCDFRDAHKKFKDQKTVILGVSPDSLKSHDKFIEKFELPFTLLSDEKKKVLEKYGVWKEKNMYGRKYMGVERTTVVIDKTGVVRKIYPKVKVKEHVKEVLKEVKSL